MCFPARHCPTQAYTKANGRAGGGAGSLFLNILLETSIVKFLKMSKHSPELSVAACSNMEGMEGCIFENTCPAAPLRLFHAVLSTKLGKVRDQTLLPALPPPHSLLASSSRGSFQQIYLCNYLSFQLYTPTGSFPAPPYLVTILKGTLLAHYISYLPLKYMIKIHTDLAKKTMLKKSLIGKWLLNTCGTTTGRNRATGLLQNFKSFL